MSNEVVQPVNGSFKVSQSVIVLVILSVLVGTFLRISLLPLYPLIAIIVFIQLRLRVAKSCIELLILILLSLTLSVFNGFYPKYTLLSLFYMLPFTFLLFSYPARDYRTNADLLKVFMTSLSVVALLNNIMGFIQVIRYPGSDDSFTGFYSTFSISLNGLSLLNAVLSTYYFHLFLASKKWLQGIYSLFFLICFIMGFYGAGLIVFMVAFTLVFYRWNYLSIIKLLFISLVSFTAIYYTIKLVKPSVLDYNIANLKKISSFDILNGPRKLTAFYNYSISYPKNPKDFLFGSGPGTFNSRSAFIVGSPSYFSGAGILKSDNQPYYFKNYAYTLWNHTNTSQALYQDGFRNQPFSSLLAFLGEYGLIFTLYFAWYFYHYYKQITAQPTGEIPKLYFAYRRLTKFLFCFLALLLVIDNFYEYPEIMLLILVTIKLLHAEMFKMTHATQDKILIKTY